MKRRGLFVVTLLTVLLTGFVLLHAGWLAGRSARAELPRRAELHSHKLQEVLAGDIGWRYRHAQPSHWRACLLQH